LRQPITGTPRALRRGVLAAVETVLAFVILFGVVLRPLVLVDRPA
jgi:hypothetical protein